MFNSFVWCLPSIFGSSFSLMLILSLLAIAGSLFVWMFIAEFLLLSMSTCSELCSPTFSLSTRLCDLFPASFVLLSVRFVARVLNFSSVLVPLFINTPNSLIFFLASTHLGIDPFIPNSYPSISLNSSLDLFSVNHSNIILSNWAW